jgi:hypothetical protein
VKKGVLIGIIVGVVLILIVAGFFILTNNPGSQNNQNLNQDTFSACQSSTQTTPFGQGGTYTISVIGLENGNCHWRYSLQLPGLNQTQNCYYPLSDMSSKAFEHLFGQDKTGTECLSDVCKQQDSLQQTYCS